MVMTTLSLLGVPLSSLSLSFFSLSFLSRLDSFFLGSAVAVVWGWSAWAESSSLLSVSYFLSFLESPDFFFSDPAAFSLLDWSRVAYRTGPCLC